MILTKILSKTFPFFMCIDLDLDLTRAFKDCVMER